MHAGLFGREERPFEMNTENTRLYAGERFDRGDRRDHFCRTVAYQSGKQSRGAKAAMRRRDLSYRLRRRCIVKQNIATAVDLNVDKSWRQPDALGQLLDRPIGRNIGALHHPFDSVTSEQHCRIGMRYRTVKHMTRGNRMPALASGAHRVRVTFCKCGGRSASVPRSAASLTRSA